MNNLGHNDKPVVEHIMKGEVEKKLHGLPVLPVRREIAHEVISMAYGFFTPVSGFMGRDEVTSTLSRMELPDGSLWSIPIVLDVKQEEIKRLGLKPSDSVLLEYLGAPLATLDIDEFFSYDLGKMAEMAYGTRDPKHPGVKRTMEYSGDFVAGRINLVNEPVFNEPFSEFWKTPLQHRQAFAMKNWKNVVAHQTRNVPHSGHESLMKQAWFAANEDMPVDEIHTGVLVNAIIGEKRTGDYIDEAILLGQDALRKGGYFKDNVHMVTFTLWDMRYAGPREAIFHAILRTNLGCTHHMFGRDHAGVGNFYKPYDAQDVLKAERDKLKIKPVFLRENWYCPVCNEVTNEALCGHENQSQNFSGTLIRSILTDGVKPTKRVMRPEVFDVVMSSADKYGFGSPFVTNEYLNSRQPVFNLQKMEVLAS